MGQAVLPLFQFISNGVNRERNTTFDENREKRFPWKLV